MNYLTPLNERYTHKEKLSQVMTWAWTLRKNNSHLSFREALKMAWSEKRYLFETPKPKSAAIEFELVHLENKTRWTPSDYQHSEELRVA